MNLPPPTVLKKMNVTAIKLIAKGLMNCVFSEANRVSDSGGNEFTDIRFWF